MTTVFCALKPEAEPLIRELDLKPISSTLYESDDIRLVITGIGKLNAASSAGFCLGKYGVSDHYINYGTAAGSDEFSGQTFFAGQVIDAGCGKEFFPDIADTEFKHISLVTSDVPVAEIYDRCHIYDMEASGIFSALKNAVTPDRIIFIKTVTDSGEPDFAKTKKMIYKASDSVASYIKKISVLPSVSSQENEDLLNELCEEFKCSESMRVQLKQYVKYQRVSGNLTTLSSRIASLREDGLLPAPDRRHGKQALSQLMVG